MCLRHTIPVLVMLALPPVAVADPFSNAVAMVSRVEQQDGIPTAVRDSISRQFPGALRNDVPGLPADAQPTPYPEIGRAINLLKPAKDETLVDFGCGTDARVCIAASQYYGCDAVGIEIDPLRAKTARKHVDFNGMNHRVDIIEGDATETQTSADVGFAYLWPETLSRLKPQIEKLDRFVSYMHAVPGLPMTKRGNLYLWEKKPQQQVMTSAKPQQQATALVRTTAERPVAAVMARPQQQVMARPRPAAVWNGRAYSGPVCNSRGCVMCNSLRGQLR